MKRCWDEAELPEQGDPYVTVQRVTKQASMGSGGSAEKVRIWQKCGEQVETLGAGCEQGFGDASCGAVGDKNRDASGGASCWASGGASEDVQERSSGENDADGVERPTPEK